MADVLKRPKLEGRTYSHCLTLLLQYSIHLKLSDTSKRQTEGLLQGPGNWLITIGSSQSQDHGHNEAGLTSAVITIFKSDSCQVWVFTPGQFYSGYLAFL